MSKIKTRETHKNIKTLDKAAVAAERMKDSFVRSKEAAAKLSEEGQGSPNEYAGDKVQQTAADGARDAAYLAAEQGKRLAVKRGMLSAIGQLKPNRSPRDISSGVRRKGPYQVRKHRLSERGCMRNRRPKEGLPIHSVSRRPWSNLWADSRASKPWRVLPRKANRHLWSKDGKWRSIRPRSRRRNGRRRSQEKCRHPKRWETRQNLRPILRVDIALLRSLAAFAREKP